MNNLGTIVFGLLFFSMSFGRITYAEQALIAYKTEVTPVIDGQGTDTSWAVAKEIITHDKIADIDVSIKALYTDKSIYFLVKFPDSDESRAHKSWKWNKKFDAYEGDIDREDVFQFVFMMGDNPGELSVFSDNEYKADVWFWKACRTDPVGYADDKMNILSKKEIEKANPIISRSGNKMYLFRPQDKGTSSFEPKLYDEYSGDYVPGFITKLPLGSAADIKAKGIWKEKFWTIEFSRALDTGNDDDIQFILKKEYLFGVSRYEISGKDKPDPKISQPLYGCGDVGERLKLTFEK